MLTYVKAMLSKNGEKGASAVEYALIAGLIAVVIILAVTTLGENMDEIFTEIGDKIGGAGE